MNTVQNEFISKFDIHSSAPEGALYSFAALELAGEEKIREFVDCYSPLMKALEEKAVAVYFASNIGSAALALQYAVSLLQCAPDLSLPNLNIHLIPEDNYCRFAFSLNEWKTTAAPVDPKERIEWRNTMLDAFYRDTAGPLMRSVTEACGLRVGEAWGQLPTRFNYYVERLAAEIGDSAAHARLKEDYSYLMNEMPAAIFGLSRNPFKVTVRKIEDIADPGRTVNMRNRCCMYYSTEGGYYCYTCPRLKESERAARRVEHRERLLSQK
ncbi:hypothetical protein GCM10010912_05070 [Paenibacillus albidus]|uniref:Ferric siderophore reductase C-terminal domain-containing protein n=1 Tax=Paenibacillus albidus TaxID=2041023 RepID=A0A917BZE1_9BACL|nr:(2Fe-2S)-binding protein [Paenibacillus albidus]GGF62960.1 hypothetical protein GCM10010912_05070 [Paenibacillus albidus]